MYLEFPFVHSRIFFLTEQSVAARIIRPLRTVSRGVVITSTAITREEENCAVMSTRNLWSLSTFLGKSRCFEGAQRAFLSAQSKYIFDLVSPKANGWVSSRRFDLAFL